MTARLMSRVTIGGSLFALTAALVAPLAASSAQAATDTAAPVISDIEVEKGRVILRTPGSIGASLHLAFAVNDPGAGASGIDRVVATLISPYASPAKQVIAQSQLTAHSNSTDYYSFSPKIPVKAPAGPAQLRITAWDRAGNVSEAWSPILSIYRGGKISSVKVGPLKNGMRTFRFTAKKYNAKGKLVPVKRARVAVHRYGGPPYKDVGTPRTDNKGRAVVRAKVGRAEYVYPSVRGDGYFLGASKSVRTRR